MRESQTLRLRQPQRDDYEFLTELFSDKAVLGFVAGGRRDYADEVIKEMSEGPLPARDKRYWIGERIEDSLPIGYISALRYSTPRVEVAFAVSPHFRHLGYGHELVGNLLHHLSNTPHIQTVVAVIHYHNSISRRILLQAGFIASDPFGTSYEKSFMRSART